MEAPWSGNTICPGIRWSGSLPGFVCRQPDRQPPHLVTRPNHSTRGRTQFCGGYPARRCLIHGALYHASTWNFYLARDTPGAMGAGLLWELAKKAFLFFVSTYISVSNLVYGSVAAIIAFLVWAYLSGLIFLFGAFLSVSYYQLKQQQTEAVAQYSVLNSLDASK